MVLHEIGSRSHVAAMVRSCDMSLCWGLNSKVLQDALSKKESRFRCGLLHDLAPNPFPSIPLGGGGTAEGKDASLPTCHHILPQDPSACSLEIRTSLLALGHMQIILSVLKEQENWLQQTGIIKGSLNTSN